MACRVYQTLTSIASPLLFFHLRWRRWRGLEHPLLWLQKLARPSLPRPPGPLIWFHAVSVGEAMSAIPVIKYYLSARPSLNILLTTFTLTSYNIMQKILPDRVLCQFAPLDTPVAVEKFLDFWQPDVGIFMESELWPNLILASSLKGTKLVLLNARMSSRSFECWSSSILARQLLSQMLSKFCLILPQSTKEAVRYQILGANPTIIHFGGNLKYAVGASNDSDLGYTNVWQLKNVLCNHHVWIAASTHSGEEEEIAWVHLELKQAIPNLITIIAPRHPERGKSIVKMLQQLGLQVSCRSCGDKIHPQVDIYVVDTIGELNLFYQISSVAFIGGSLFKGMNGHNLAEAAASRCAVITGKHIGHFAEMVSEFHSISPLSVQQVSGRSDLTRLLEVFFGDSDKLQACREAAWRASQVCAEGVISKVCYFLDLFVLQHALQEPQCET